MPPNMEMDDQPLPERVRPAITRDQGVTDNTSATDEGDSTTNAKTKSPGRRVNFPADDMLVTGYLEAPNPWEKGLNTTPDELVAAYKEACERHNIKPLPKVLQQLQGLILFGVDREDCLSLKGEKLDLKHYDAMEEIFKRVRFKTIDVESTNLDDEGSVALFDMIEYYESTETLNISSNKNMSTRGWQACARMLKKTHCLEALDAHNTGLNEQFMALLCRTLRSGSYLTRLHLESCNLSGRACTVLMTALKLNSSLRELYLAENKLSSTDALQIGNLLRANTKLQLMDLRNNHIQDTGVSHIVDGLNDQSMGPGEGLQTLVLWSNQLTFNSSNHLSKALVSSKNLKALNIGCNNITNEGIFLLKDALMKNRTLQQLGLQATRITCEGAVALAEYIADNPCVQQIDMRENNIKVAGLLALSLSMKVNHSVTRLDLDKDPKKESKELQDQHQRLLLEIIEYCERNHQEAEQIRLMEEKRQKQLELEEPEERLSESVCRLLSLWDPAPSSPKGCGAWPLGGTPEEIKNAGCTPGRPVLHGSPLRTTPHEGSYIQHLNAPDSQPSPPIIVLPDGGEASTRPPVSIGLPRAALRSVNPSLLSPPAGCPSPPKSRFRVCRVVMDTSDTLLSSAGSTPMPSPVPSPGNTPLPSPGCTPLPSPGCTPLPSPTASPIGSPISSPLRVMTPNSIPISVCSPISSTRSIMKAGTHANSNDIKHERQKPMFVVTTVSIPHVGLNKDLTASVTTSCAKDTAVVTTTSISPSSLPSTSLSAITNGICAPPSSPAGSEMLSVTSTPSDSFLRSLGSPSDLISLHSPISTSLSTASSDPTPPTAFTFSETEKAPPNTPPNTPAETTSSISDFSDPPSLTVTDDLGLSSRSLTSSSSSSGSLTVSGYKSSSPASVPWTPSPVESEAETKLSTCLSGMSPTSESTLSPVSYPSAISVVSSSDASPSLDTTSLSKSYWPTPETSLYSPSAETTELSPSPANANDEGHSWDNGRSWDWRTKNSPTSIVSGRFSVGVCGSDSMVSLDSGVATPGSELSTGSDQAKNTAALVSATGSTTKIIPPGFLCLGFIAPPCSPVDSPLSLNCGSGMMAPPSSPMEPEIRISNSLVLSAVNSPTANSKTAVGSSICPTDGNINETLGITRNLHPSREEKLETTDFDIKSVPYIKISTPKSLPIERNLQPLSPNQSEKKAILSPSTGVVSPAKSPPSHLRRRNDGGKSPDSTKAVVSPTHSGRTRKIRLAEPSCVLLFGGGIPKSNSPSKESNIDLSATPPTPPDLSPKANNPQLQNIVMAELARSVATVEATCASLGKLLQESLTAEVNSTTLKEPDACTVLVLDDTKRSEEEDKDSASRASSHYEDKAISSSFTASDLVMNDGNNATPISATDRRHSASLTTTTKHEKYSAENNSSIAVSRLASFPFSDENGNVPAVRRKSEMLAGEKLSSYEPVLQLIGIQQSRRHQLRKSFSEQDSKGLVRRKSTGSYPGPSRKNRAAMVRQATLTLDALIEKQLVELNLSLRNTAKSKECDSDDQAYHSLPCDPLNTTPSVDMSKNTLDDRVHPVHMAPRNNEGSGLLTTEKKEDHSKVKVTTSTLTVACATANEEHRAKNSVHYQQNDSTVLCVQEQLPTGSAKSSIVHNTDEADADCCAAKKLDTYKPSGLDKYKDTVLLSGRESYSSVLKRSLSSPTQKTIQDDVSIVTPTTCSSTRLSSNYKDSVVCRSAATICNPDTPCSASGQSQVMSGVCIDGLAENCVVISLDDPSRSEVVLSKAKESLLQSECNVASVYSVKSDTVSSLCNVVLRKDPKVPKVSLEPKLAETTESVIHNTTDCDTISNVQSENVSDGTSLPARFNHNDVASVSASVIRQRLVGNSVPADQTVVANNVFCTNGILLDNKESFCSPPVTSPCGSNGLNLNLCFLSEELGSSQARLDTTDLNLSMSSQEATSPETLTT